MLVPFNRPFLPEASFNYLSESLQSGHLSGDGPMTAKAVRLLATLTRQEHHLLVPSCTHALELACRLLNLSPGQEVILPSFNFPSAATAVVLTGATPVFVDVDPVTKNLTVEGVVAAVSDRTRAVVVLHYAGVEAPVREIRKITDAIGAHIIEDAAHGLGIASRSGMLGQVGSFATYSFHETKNFQCGEGGALQFNDESFVERAEILREKGTNRKHFFQGQVDKYSWIDLGSSWLLADPLAAMLLGQFEQHAHIQQRRGSVVKAYRESLAEWSIAAGFTITEIPEGHDDAAHMFYLTAPSLAVRKRFIEQLREHGVYAAFHYQPLHRSQAGQRFGRSEPCPVSDFLGDHLVRLPVFADMNIEETQHVIEQVKKFEA